MRASGSSKVIVNVYGYMASPSITTVVDVDHHLRELLFLRHCPVLWVPADGNQYILSLFFLYGQTSRTTESRPL